MEVRYLLIYYRVLPFITCNIQDYTRGIKITCYRGGQLPNNRNDITNLRREVADLEAKENTLDRLIHGADKNLRELCADRQYAYVTYHDLRSVSMYKNQAIMAVKAPPEATLHVPQPINNFGPQKVKCFILSTPTWFFFNVEQEIIYMLFYVLWQ